MENSFYEQFKEWLLNLLAVSADAFHIYLGIACLLGVFFISRRRSPEWWMLVPGVLLSLNMEFVDLWNGYHVWEKFRITASFHDIVTTNICPVLMVVLMRLRKREKVKVPRQEYYLGRMFSKANTNLNHLESEAPERCPPLHLPERYPEEGSIKDRSDRSPSNWI